MRISYTVSIPETKAPVTADGAAVNKVWYALYNTDGTLATNYAPVDFVNGNARCEVVMMRDRSYKIVFVAQHYSDEATPAYPINSETATICLPESPEANTDNYDLFYGTQDIANSTGSAAGSIVLDRIVAMVNFTCTDRYYDETQPTHSSIVLSGVSNGWNLLTGKASSTKADLSFTKAEIPSQNHLGAAFCFVNGDITATLSLYGAADAPIETMTVNDVKVETNKKTNIEIQ